jgi:hypothetical protein
VTMILVSERLTVACLRDAAKNAELNMCTKPGCGEHPRSEFHQDSSSVTGLVARCKSCVRARELVHAGTKEGFFRLMAKTCRHSASIRSGAASICELDRYDLQNMWDEQHGLCALTGVPMTHDSKSNFKASPERRDNRLGYVEGNVILIIAEFNTPAQWTAEKLDVLLRNVNPTPEHHAIQDAYVHTISNPPPRQPRVREPIRREVVNGITMFTCNGCTLSTSESDYGSNNRCKNCMNAYKLKYRSELHGTMMYLVVSARLHSRTRKEGKGGGNCSIDAAYLETIFIKQRGRCYWTGIPMKFGIDIPWMCSLERLDVKLGYEPKNVALVVWEANTSDQTNQGEYRKSVGSAGWSRDKMDLVIRHLKQKRTDEALTQAQAQANK